MQLLDTLDKSLSTSNIYLHTFKFHNKRKLTKQLCNRQFYLYKIESKGTYLHVHVISEAKEISNVENYHKKKVWSIVGLMNYLSKPEKLKGINVCGYSQNIKALKPFTISSTKEIDHLVNYSRGSPLPPPIQKYYKGKAIEIIAKPKSRLFHNAWKIYKTSQHGKMNKEQHLNHLSKSLKEAWNSK